LQVIVQIASPRLREARELIAELDAYLGKLYPPERNYLLDVESLCSPEITFLVARCDAAAVGCGALRRRDEHSAELKRMYVRAQYRGYGVARALLAALEEQARSWGTRLLLLETGVDQPEALSLYESAGYRRRDRYGEYGGESSSVFMEKLL
jgi:putative acetyltransferase